MGSDAGRHAERLVGVMATCAHLEPRVRTLSPRRALAGDQSVRRGPRVVRQGLGRSLMCASPRPLVRAPADCR